MLQNMTSRPLSVGLSLRTEFLKMLHLFGGRLQRSCTQSGICRDSMETSIHRLMMHKTTSGFGVLVVNGQLVWRCKCRTLLWELPRMNPINTPDLALPPMYMVRH